MSDPLQRLRTEGPDPERESQALGQWLLARGGLEPRPGLVAVASSSETRRVPWARRADWLLLPSEDGLVLARLSCAQIAPGENLAGEERDEVVLDGGADREQITVAPDLLGLRGALVRAVLMAGALERICQLSLSHARERRQFGRAIGSFQAVQAHLVTVSQQAALVSVAVDAAIARGAAFEIATAKLLAGRAAVAAARAAHQVHGAIGVTREHALGVQTRRLWAWRSEFGTEQEWADRLAQAMLRAGADRLYPVIAGGSRELEA
jgi:acyl-CoA dehydrogenase